MDEAVKQKVTSLFEIFIGFLIVDGDIEQVESDDLFMEFVDYLEEYLPGVSPDIDFEDTIKKIAEDRDNFSKNANFLDLVTSHEEKVDIMRAISEVLFADYEFSDTEYELYEELMLFWNITKEDFIK